MERAQRDHAGVYRSIFDNSMDAVLLTAPDGRIAMANRACVELFGYTEAELRRLGREAVVDHTDPRLDVALATRRHTGRFRGELRMRRKDGTPIDVEVSSAIFRDEQGAEWTSMFIREITERKALEAEREGLLRAADAVRASEQMLNAIFELLPVGVWIADATGRIVRGNRAGIRIWAGARYVGPSAFGEYRAWWADSGKRIEPHDWALARAITNGETSIGEVLRIQCFDDTFKTIINSALPLYDERGRPSGAIVVNEDITQLKETEAALRQAVQSREHVLEIVAHDLRHPLQVILTVVQATLMTREQNADIQGPLTDVLEQVRRMDALIQDLLEVSQVEAGSFRLERLPLRPEALVDEVWQAHSRLASSAAVELRREVHAGLQAVDVDEGRVVQVFGNLLENALKFTPAGGRITLGAAPHDGHVRFWVADTGTGIDPESLAHVFDRRWRRDLRGRGQGLGLAIARSIIEAHGGRIWVESTLGRGTTVSFTLPSAAAAAPVV